jgi:anti-anti-sigma factor
MGAESSGERTQLGLTLTTSRSADRVVVRCTGELDLGTVGAFLLALEEAIEADSGPIELDLGDLAFMDSSGVGAYVHAFRQAQSKGVRLTIGERSGAVQRVLELSGVEVALAAESAN